MNEPQAIKEKPAREHESARELLVFQENQHATLYTAQKNDEAIREYVHRIGEIGALADKLVEFAEDHGDLSPEDIQPADVARLTDALATLQAACAILGNRTVVS